MAKSVQSWQAAAVLSSVEIAFRIPISSILSGKEESFTAGLKAQHARRQSLNKRRLSSLPGFVLKLGRQTDERGTGAKLERLNDRRAGGLLQTLVRTTIGQIQSERRTLFQYKTYNFKGIDESQKSKKKTKNKSSNKSRCARCTERKGKCQNTFLLTVHVYNGTAGS